MKLSLVLFSFLLSFSVFGAMEVKLSSTDSKLLMQKTVLPFLKSEVVKEEGKEFYLETRELKSSDGLIGFTCTRKLFSGEEVAAQCVVSLDDTAKVQTGNQVEKGYFNLTRVTIAWAGDVSPFGQAFREAGICHSTKKTQLFKTRETKELGISPGKIIPTPLLTVGCVGSPQKQLSQFVIMLVQR